MCVYVCVYAILQYFNLFCMLDTLQKYFMKVLQNDFFK